MKTQQIALKMILWSSIIFFLTILLYVVISIDMINKGISLSSISPIYRHIVDYSGFFVFVCWIYSIVLWNKHDKNGLILLCLIFFHVLYMPFYYFRIKKLSFQPRLELQHIAPNGESMKIHQQIALKMILWSSIICQLLILSCVIILIETIGQEEVYICIMQCCGFFVFVCWIYSIVLWNKYDKNGLILLCLIFLSTLYMPFYYFRIKKLISQPH